MPKEIELLLDADEDVPKLTELIPEELEFVPTANEFEFNPREVAPKANELIPDEFEPAPTATAAVPLHQALGGFFLLSPWKFFDA